MNPKRQNIYLSENDNEFIQKSNFNKFHENLRTTQTSCQISHHHKNKFYYELQIDDQYSFDLKSQSNVSSKKQIKRRKIQYKENQKILSKQQNDQQNNNNKLQQVSNINPFEEDISSISFFTEQISTHDSVFQKLNKFYEDNKVDVISNSAKQQNFIQNNQSDDLRSQSQYEQSQQKDSMINQNQNEQIQSKNQNVQNNFQQNLQDFSKPNNITYKNTWMKFQNLNRCTQKFLQKNQGVIIHPQYSTLAQDCSQLAVQGKPFIFKIKSRVKHANIQHHANFLKQVFQNQQQPCNQEQFNFCQQDQNLNPQITQQKQKLSNNPKHQQTQQDTIGFKQKYLS